MLHYSTITQKGQATIPVEIRHRLKLHADDKVAYEVQKNNVILKKAEAFDYEYHKALTATLSEWTSQEDDKAYDGL